VGGLLLDLPLPLGERAGVRGLRLLPFLSLAQTARQRSPVPDPGAQLAVLAETRHWAAIDKPAGLLSVPGLGPDKQDSVQSRARARWPHASGPITVHRLDMDTSGVILVALDEDTHRALSLQFQNRRTRKTYLALLAGHPAPDEGLIDLPLRTDYDRRPYQVVDFDRGKPARTRFAVLERTTTETGPVARLRFEPITGRSHQLRVHAAARTRIVHRGAPRPGGLGCPILGDPLYGARDRPAARLMLHAEKLEFTDPATGERVHAASPAPFAPAH